MINLQITPDKFDLGIFPPSEKDYLKGEIVKRFPPIYINGYRPNTTAIQNLTQADSNLFDTLKGLIGETVKQAKTGIREINALIGNREKMINLYKLIYRNNPDNPEVKMTLPYLSPYHHDVTQNWGEFSGPLTNLAQGIQQNIKYYLPAGGVEVPKFWTGNNPAQFTVVFQLYNTVNQNNIINHYKAIKDFVRLVSPTKVPMFYISPYTFEIAIPGIRYAPFCYISHLAINNIGQMTKMKLPGDTQNKNYVIPDSWEIQINFAELLQEQDGFMENSWHNKVVATVDAS